MVKNIVKINQSSILVIRTLIALLEDNYTMNKLIEKLNDNEDNLVFNNATVSKYINTCRYCGFEIPKIQNKYYVASMPFGVELSREDLDLFSLMQDIAKNSISTSQYKKFINLITKISKYSNKHIIRIEKNTADVTFEKFERAVEEKRKIRLMFKAKDILECIPLGIVQSKGKTYLNVLDETKNKERMIYIERLSGLEILNTKFYPKLSERSVVYKLYGGLAKRYALRENETMTTNSLPDYIVITNKGEPQEMLLSRLMRYDKDCEVIAPLEFKKLISDNIDKALKNYGE